MPSSSCPCGRLDEDQPRGPSEGGGPPAAEVSPEAVRIATQATRPAPHACWHHRSRRGGRPRRPGADLSRCTHGWSCACPHPHGERPRDRLRRGRAPGCDRRPPGRRRGRGGRQAAAPRRAHGARVGRDQRCPRHSRPRGLVAAALRRHARGGLPARRPARRRDRGARGAGGRRGAGRVGMRRSPAPTTVASTSGSSAPTAGGAPATPATTRAGRSCTRWPRRSPSWASPSSRSTTSSRLLIADGACFGALRVRPARRQPHGVRGRRGRAVRRRPHADLAAQLLAP